MAQFGLDNAVQLGSIDADAVEHRSGDAVALGEHGRQEVQRVDLRMPAVGRQRLRSGNGLLGLDGQFVETKCHNGQGAVPSTRSADGRETE